MVNFRDVAKLTNAIPGFLDNNANNANIGEIKLAIEETRKELGLAKKMFDIDDYSRAIIEFAEIEISSYEADLFTKDHVENLDISNAVISHVITAFSHKFNCTITNREFSEIRSKAVDVYFKNDEHCKLLNSLEASKGLIDFLLSQLSKKFAVHELDKKKIKRAIDKIRDESILVAGVLITAKENNIEFDINFNI